MTPTERAEIEKRVITQLLEIGRSYGYHAVAVDDGGDRVETHTDTEVFDTVFSVDSCTLYMKRPEDVKAHAVVIVLGNSGYDCIADHSCGPIWDDVMKDVNAFCDTLESGYEP